MTRWLIGFGLLIAMVAFGVGVYEAAGYLRGHRNVVHRPTEVSAPSLPGTIYVVQNGAIYRFQHGNFAQITSEGGWMQPSAAPNHQLVFAMTPPSNRDAFDLGVALNAEVPVRSDHDVSGL